MIDQAEIQKIQVANSELETTLKTKNKLLSREEKEAADNASKAAKKTVTPTLNTLQVAGNNPKSATAFGDDMFKYGGADIDAGATAKSSSGGFKGFVNGIKYMFMHGGTDVDVTGTSEQNSNLSILDATNKDLKDYEAYTKKIRKLREEQANSTSVAESKQIGNEIEQAEKMKDILETNLSTRQEELDTMMKAVSVNGEGTKALDGYEELFSQLKTKMTQISTKDLTDTEKALSSLNTFFDGSMGKNAIKEELQDTILLCKIIQKLKFKYRDL